MKKYLYKYIFSLISFFAIGHTENINFYKHLTSTLNSTDISFFNNSTLVSTHGGLYYLINGEYNFVEGLLEYNIIDISISNNQKIWISSKNNGIIQILNDNFSLHSVINYPSYDLIKSIIHTELFTYAIGCNGDCTSNANDSSTYYLIQYDDIYQVNQISINSLNGSNVINDICVYDDKIILATDSGIIYSSLDDNLVYSNSWNSIDGINNSVKILHDDYFIMDNALYNIVYSTEQYNLLYSDVFFNENIIDLYVHDNGSNYFILTDNTVYELNSSNEVLLLFQKPNDIIQPFTSLYVYGSTFSLGVQNGGLVHYSQGVFNRYIPNTLFQNNYDAIYADDNNNLVGISNAAGFIINNVNSNYSNVNNFYPTAFNSLYLYNFHFQKTDSDYLSNVLPYWSGGVKQPSIVFDNENIIFTNSGSYPYTPGNIEAHYNGIFNSICNNVLTNHSLLCELSNLPDISYYGALGVLNQFNLSDITLKSNGVIGGLKGILESSYSPDYQFDENSGYMIVSQIKKDMMNNVWVVNPFCENYYRDNGFNRPVAFKLNNSDDWYHIYDDNPSYFIPKEIAFSDNNLLWISYNYHELNFNSPYLPDGDSYSAGGIRVVSYNNLINESDDEWFDIVLPFEYNGVDIWSIDVGKDKNNNEILWILSELGVQGYIINVSYINANISNITLQQINNNYYYSDISFIDGNKVRVDYNGNAWISTSNDGLRIIKSDGQIYFSTGTDKIDKQNYSLLSNVVYDLAFDEKGFVYIASDNGITILSSSFSNDIKPDNISISPNPYIIGDHNEIIFSNVGGGTIVNIMTLNGAVIKTFYVDYNNEPISWNGLSDKMQKIPSGIYLVSAYNKDKNTGVNKIIIMNK